MWAFHCPPDTEPVPGIGIGFTDAVGGVTPDPGLAAGPTRLSFGAHDGGPAALAQNYRLLHEAADIDRVITLRQIHSADVHVVDRAFLDRYDPHDAPPGDALVGGPDLPARIALAVRAADCVPVVCVDAEAGVIGAAHAGRAGMLAGVVPRTVAAMRDLGAARISAWIGPHIHGSCYEVPAEMARSAAEVLPAARTTTRWGTDAIDLTAGVVSQLEEAGVEVLHTGACTFDDPRLHSHRRDGAGAGRQVGLVWRA